MKLISDWKKHLKSYSFISLASNAFVAISISGLSVLGVLSSEIAFPLLAALAVFFGVVGAIGRFVDQELDDLKRESSENDNANE